jgi:uncharacterized protein RhaS with RHS repeats
MQARYYDPVIGRFYSNDPVGYTSQNPVMSFNRYLYVNNNPYKYTDPNGEFLFLVLFVPELILLGEAALFVGSAALAGYAGSEAIDAYNESSEDTGDSSDSSNSKETKKDRRKRIKEERKERKRNEPASEDTAKWIGKETEKKHDKEKRREGHDKKQKGEPDRTREQLEEDNKF